jgi:hypothetical protein
MESVEAILHSSTPLRSITLADGASGCTKVNIHVFRDSALPSLPAANWWHGAKAADVKNVTKEREGKVTHIYRSDYGVWKGRQSHIQSRQRELEFVSSFIL